MKALVYVGSVVAVVSYAGVYMTSPYGLGFLYALLLCISIATLSPFIGLLIAE